jgi:hypothetical protein
MEARVSHIKRIGQDSGAHKVKVAFLGCWDTVDAFFLPSRFPREGRWNKFKDKVIRVVKPSLARLFRFEMERFKGDENKIPQEVHKAVHCVAIDETRNAFLPTLMPHAPNVEEVWFPGVHSDVGGGYDDNLLTEEPYQFMKSRLIAAVKAHGGNVETLFKDKKKNISYEYCFHFHGLNSGVFKGIKDLVGFGRDIRRIRVLDAPPNVKVKPKIHSSVENIRQSGFVSAANRDDKRTWNITYEPYNVRELRDNQGNNTQKHEDNFEYAYTDEKAALRS